MCAGEYIILENLHGSREYVQPLRCCHKVISPDRAYAKEISYFRCTFSSSCLLSDSYGVEKVGVLTVARRVELVVEAVPGIGT